MPLRWKECQTSLGLEAKWGKIKIIPWDTIQIFKDLTNYRCSKCSKWVDSTKCRWWARWAWTLKSTLWWWTRALRWAECRWWIRGIRCTRTCSHSSLSISMTTSKINLRRDRKTPMPMDPPLTLKLQGSRSKSKRRSRTVRRKKTKRRKRRSKINWTRSSSKRKSCKSKLRKVTPLRLRNWTRSKPCKSKWKTEGSQSQPLKIHLFSLTKMGPTMKTKTTWGNPQTFKYKGQFSSKNLSRWGTAWSKGAVMTRSSRSLC